MPGPQSSIESPRFAFPMKLYKSLCYHAGTEEYLSCSPINKIEDKQRLAQLSPPCSLAGLPSPIPLP